MPKIARITQSFSRPRVSDIAEAVASEFNRLSLGDICCGKRVGITAGSRGITDIIPLLKALIREITASGGSPVLIAAMGSHGGGTESGQRELLSDLGVTEDSLTVPVAASVSCVKIGVTNSGLEAFVTEASGSLDVILPVNRIKPHTAFHGAIESGLHKMLVVGLGGPMGAAQFHSRGADELPELLREVGAFILNKMPIPAGFAIVENAHDETALIKGVLASDFASEEPKLLNLAKSLMPSLPAQKLDALIIEEMGKNYSGTGIDTNIIGRLRIEGVPEPTSPSIQKIAVLDLSNESHGNANGIGLADITTKNLVDKIDRRATYLNCSTTGFLIRGAIPVFLDSEREMMELMLRSLGDRQASELRLIQIPNTLNLAECFVSEALLPEMRSAPHITISSDLTEMSFDANGRLTHRIGRSG
ncbi:MAG: hypothetical protein LBQ58_06680 [Synergistaceae bacterium]|jgi:hypothetical protein|nr:hypothetical protein [Synergistaceae bacterium]